MSGQHPRHQGVTLCPAMELRPSSQTASCYHAEATGAKWGFILGWGESFPLPFNDASDLRRFPW